MNPIVLVGLWRKHKARLVVCVLAVLLFALSGCAKTEVPETVPVTENDSTIAVTEDSPIPENVESKEPEVELPSEPDIHQIPTTEDAPVKTELILKIDGQAVSVAWENNESVAALRALAEEAPITIQMAMYGGFEQVGPIGTSLPRNDVQATTQAGDIVLYSGNQLVVFYGSNSWAYTRLGHITDKTAEELTELLGNGNVTLTISVE